MYCSKCGTQIAAEVKFCNECGNAIASVATPPPLIPPGQAKANSFGRNRDTWILLACVGILAIIVAVTSYTKSGSHRVLPDVKELSERIKNTKDEYAPLIRRYGYPDSILSTENDTGSDKPTVPTRVVWYDKAHLRIALVPIGCVDAFLKAASAINDASRYPALAQSEIERIRAYPCQPLTLAYGWTIMGYIDSSDETTSSADYAGVLLEKIKDKRSVEPVEHQDASQGAPKKKSADEPPTPTREDARELCEVVYGVTSGGKADGRSVKRFAKELGLRDDGKCSNDINCVSNLQRVVEQCQRLDLYPPR
jgi:hypothetical protein